MEAGEKRWKVDTPQVTRTGASESFQYETAGNATRDAGLDYLLWPCVTRDAPYRLSQRRISVMMIRKVC